MEDGIRNLLIGIGQPGFSYRNFNHLDYGALLQKWPLMTLVARQPEMAGLPFVAAKSQSDHSAAPLRQVGAARTRRPGFLNSYDPADTQQGREGGGDVRSLLDRLSEELR